MMATVYTGNVVRRCWYVALIHFGLLRRSWRRRIVRCGEAGWRDSGKEERQGVGSVASDIKENLHTYVCPSKPFMGSEILNAVQWGDLWRIGDIRLQG